MSVIRTPWGLLPDGRGVERVEIGSDVVRLGVLTWGATVQSLHTRDRAGRERDVVLGFADLAGYLGDHPWLGSTIGRFANRIAHGRFSLDGRTHQVPVNDPPHALHGGPAGWSHQLWQVVATDDRPDGGSVELALLSPDGEMGFPGEVRVTTRFSVEGGVVRQESHATTSAATVLNMTNHAYFNLHGDPARTIEDHVLRIDAEHYLPVDETAIPLPGKPAAVAGTPYDFRSSTAVGTGYDHTWVLAGAGMRTAAVAHSPATGVRLTVRTTEPGVQLYTGNFLDGSLIGKGGTPIARHGALCLETQHFPDSPNRPDYPSTVLRPAEQFSTITEWAFDTV